MVIHFEPARPAMDMEHDIRALVKFHFIFDFPSIATYSLALTPRLLSPRVFRWKHIVNKDMNLP
jgi:hypothetical protein